MILFSLIPALHNSGTFCPAPTWGCKIPGDLSSTNLGVQNPGKMLVSSGLGSGQGHILTCLHETCLPKIAHGTTEHERPPRPRLLDASTPKKGNNWAHAPVKNYDYCTQAPTTTTKTPQDAPRNLRKLYENPPGPPRKPQEAPGSPRRSQEPKQAIKNVLQIWAARAQCTNALAADLSVITKVNVLEIRAARARCTKALVAELSGITMCCNYGQPKPNARIPSHNHKHTITHTHTHTHTNKHTHTHTNSLSLSSQ